MCFNDKQKILVLISNPETEPLLMRYGSALARARQGEVVALHLTSPQEHLPGHRIGRHFWDTPTKAAHGVSIRNCCAVSDSTSDGVRSFVQNWPYALWIMGWFEDDEKRREMIRMAQRMRIPIMVVRKGAANPLPRVLVATAGGIHALEAVKIGADLAKGLSAEVEVLVIVPRHTVSATTEQLNRHCHEVAESTRFALQLAGLGHLRSRVTIRDNVVADLAQRAGRYDTLVVGGPGEWRLNDSVEGSIPDELSRVTSCNMAMVVAPQSREFALRRLLWPGTICVDMPRLPYPDAIAVLVDRLVTSRQLPATLRDRAIEAALIREEIEPTTVGSGVAIPRAALSSFPGTLAALGISRDGVRFGEGDHGVAHLVFLLITSADTSDTYLTALSRIARLVLPEKRRLELLAARTALRASNIIQDFEEDADDGHETDPLELTWSRSRDGKE